MASSAQRTQKITARTTHVPERRLNELFTDDEIEDLLAIAKLRVCKAFDWSTVAVGRGRKRGTGDNRIMFVGERPSDLVDHIIRDVVSKRWVVHSNSLPASVVGNDCYVLRKTAQAAERKLVTMVVNQMIDDGDIRYDDSGIAYWEVKVSVMDEYRKSRALVHKLDARTRREQRHGGGRLKVVH